MPKEIIYSDVPTEAPYLRPEVGWQPTGAVQLRLASSLHEDDPADGVGVELTRAQINKLIRALRRGRDQAYGKDE